jgi:hypothetical protein
VTERANFRVGGPKSSSLISGMNIGIKATPRGGSVGRASVWCATRDGTLASAFAARNPAALEPGRTRLAPRIAR